MQVALNETLAGLSDDTVVYVSPETCSRARHAVQSLTWGPTIVQPGHEYTASNVRFGLSVVQSEPVKRLDAFAKANKETTGCFTIGDEKVRHYSHTRYFPPRRERGFWHG